ncbi:MAG: leucine-rich repeat protein [Agathobacter sp.]|nr:leucine-rich repeat protein [Agathobacter sp.]
MKRIVALLLAIILSFTSGGEILASELAEDKQYENIETIERALPTGGLVKPQITVVSGEKMPPKTFKSKEQASNLKYSAIYKHDWDKYSSNYFYNLLSEEEKKFWDDMDEVCRYYLNNTVSASYDPENDCYLLDAVEIPVSLTYDDVDTLYQLFLYSNPQYYFLAIFGMIYSYRNGLENGFTLSCYKAFADGNARAAATKQMQAQIDAWVKIVSEYPTDVERLQKIYELVCEKVTYNYDYFYGIVSDEDACSQSAYSVFCMDTAVCAGYAEAMAVMCNAFDLDAVTVTSLHHQWTKVRINDNWYNFDPTWDDGDSLGTYYYYFARSENWYKEDTDDKEDDHHEDAFWYHYSPQTLLDVKPLGAHEPGVYPMIEQKTATPEITITSMHGIYRVSITSETEDAVIYYTLDGTNPSAAATKSLKYTESFLTTKKPQIKAIAVKSTYLDSDIAGGENTPRTFSITYKLDGGKNHVNNPVTFQSNTAAFTLYNPSKEGHTFKGWYYDSSFTKPVISITGNNGNITVFAKWSKDVVSISISKAKVTLSKTSYKYDGKEKRPTVKIVLDGKTLVKDTDYTVSYKNNKNIGKATVTVKGKGNYTGTISKTFTIKVEKGDAFTSGKYKYKVTGSSTVAFNGIVSSKTTKVSIPKTVKYGGKTFKITSVADKALKGKTKVTQITIGANVTKIGVSALEGCKKLSKVTLCSAVTTIEDKAFKNCVALKSITIPSKVAKIDKQAFYGCKNLKTITIKSTKLKTVGKESFKKIYAKATIKVPKAKLKSYQKLLKKAGLGSKVKIKKG